MPMRPKQRIAVSREARWKQKVKTWASMTSRSADSSDSTSNEGMYEPSSESSEEDGGHREALLEPKQEELSEALDAGIGVPSSSQEEENESDTVVLKSKVGKALESGAGNSVQGVPVESATSSKDINNTGCDSKPPGRSFDCTSCGKKLFSVWEIKKHPDLGVGICRGCYNFLFSSPYTKDSVDCSEEQCRWCGQGGRIVMCDHCDKSFCEACIIRNYGPKDLALIVNNSNWSCFRCDPELLRVPIIELKQFQHSQFSATNPFSLKRKKKSISSWPGNRITREAREDIMSTESEGPTIAELVALEEERRKQNKGMWTNSTRVKSTTHKLARRVIEKKKKATSTELYKKVFHPATTEVKPKQEVIVEQAPASAPAPARAWIRPHQWAQKRQEAAERRKRAEDERLKNNITGSQSEEQHLQAHNLEADGDQKLRAQTQTVKSVDLSDALVGN